MIRVPNDTLRLAVAIAIPAILGSAGAPIARAQDPQVTEKIARLEEDLESKLEHRRFEAIHQLGMMGADARRVLPKFISYLESSDDLTIRMYAARAAQRIDPSNKKVSSLLLGILKDHDQSYALREVAAVALGEMAEATPSLTTEIVEVLAEELGSGDQGNIVDTAIAGSLGRLGERASSAAQDIEVALARSPFGEVQIATFLALARVSKGQPGATPDQLVAGLDDPHLAVRATSFGQLRAMGEPAAKTAPALVQIAQTDRPLYERVAALDCLGAIAPGDPQAIAAFIAAASTPARWLSNAGEMCLRQVKPGLSAPAVEALLAGLTSPDELVRRSVVRTLTRVAPGEPRTVRAMLELLGRVDARSEPIYVFFVLEALRAAGPAASAAGPRLVAMLDRGQPMYQALEPLAVEERVGHALVVLSEIGMPPEATAPVLAEFEKRTLITLTPSIRAVGALGSRGAPAVPGLIAFLEGKRHSQSLLPFLLHAKPQLEAIRALGRIGPAAKAAIPLLTKLSGRDTRDISNDEILESQAARTALEEIQG